MVNKVKTCVFISGQGSNLNSIIKSSRDYNFPIKIQLIISNNINAAGLPFAKRYSIPYKFFPSDDKEKFERNCLFEIKKRKIKFLCLAGFMKILSNNFIKLEKLLSNTLCIISYFSIKTLYKFAYNSE